MTEINRRTFIKAAAVTGVALGVSKDLFALGALGNAKPKKREKK